MNFEQALFDSLARIVVQPQTDQWGNITASPISQAMTKWTQTNQEAIAACIMKKYKVEKFADIVAEKVVSELCKRSSWEKNYAEEELHKRVMEIVAQRLADEQMEKLKQKL